MRLILASLATVLTLAPLAQAQESALAMPAPSISDTERAEPEWFKQFTFSDEASTTTPVWQARPSKTFKLAWAEGERWSVRVDLTSRDGASPLPREEMSAGAEFRITPRISVGGELSIGAEELDDTTQWQQQQIEAGIRLRSAFKF